MTRPGLIYGDALYELAFEEGSAKEVKEELEFLKARFKEEPGFLKLLSCPSLAKEERTELLDECFEGSLRPSLLNFLKLLTEQGNILSFSDCCKRFTERYNEDKGILPVQALSAVEIPEELKARLEARLREITGKEPEV
ncbi:MAG: ATP synthase F1 subunit delta, partial [Oscillospiraceae bacterium]|nr:ATP synthase F1 subunit delta [Oscillospiraceae bacterium]